MVDLRAGLERCKQLMEGRNADLAAGIVCAPRSFLLTDEQLHGFGTLRLCVLRLDRLLVELISYL